MSDLEGLQKKLYTPPHPVLPPVESESILLPPQPETPMAPPEEFSKRSLRKFILGLAVFALLALSVAVFIFYRGFYAFRKDRILVKLEGPAEIIAGETAQWHLTIENKNETALKEGELNFRFPDYSKPIIAPEESEQFADNLLKQVIKIPELAAGGKFEKEFKAVINGGENFERKSQAIFNFKPSSGSIIFESIITQAMRISDFPLEIQINLKHEIISGKKVSLNLKLINQGSAPLGNMRLRWEYPPGFKFLTSSSALNNFDNTWLVPEILPGEVKELHLEGEIKGLAGETKVFRVFVENQEGASWKVYKEAMASINLIAEPLVLTLNTVPADQKSVRAGDLLTYKLTWKNNFNAPLENLVLKVKLIGEMFDWNTLISAGNFNIDNQTITWSKLSQPFMASAQPLEQQEISFQIKLKNVFSAGINPNITTAANIYSSTQPEGLDIDQITSETGLILNVEP